MTKLEAWNKWINAIGFDGADVSLEMSSHGKAFSYAWKAAAQAERESCAELANGMLLEKAGDKSSVVYCGDVGSAIITRGKT